MSGIGNPSCRGLSDKLYWRDVNGGWHCFRRARPGKGYVSLCARTRLERTGGQAIDRPEPIQRCSLCDAREIDRRGKDESMPARRDPKRLAAEVQRAKGPARLVDEADP